MEFEIVKSIIKFLMGRDFKVVFKIFCVVMKNIIEWDFDCFEAVFVNVVEIRIMVDILLSIFWEYVILMVEVKVM